MEFKLSRFINLVRRDVLLSRKLILFGVVALFILTGLLMWMVADEDNPNVPEEAGEIVYVFLLIIGGFFFTSSAFKSYRSHPLRIQYLSLPASHFEKFFSRWLYTLPFYALVSFIIFCAGYFIFSSLIENMFDVIFISFADLDFLNIGYILFAYTVIHGVTLLLASVINQHPIPKIIISGAVITVFCFALFSLIYRIIFWNYFDGLFSPSEEMTFYQLDSEFKLKMDDFIENWAVIFCLLAMPFLWAISYFKIKEKEA